MKFFENVLYYGFMSLVVYYLLIKTGSYIEESFKGALIWTKKKFPRTSKFVDSVFLGIEAYLSKMSLAKLSFRFKVFSDKVELWIANQDEFGTFKKISSSSLASEDDFSFQLIDVSDLLIEKYSFEGFFDSQLWRFGESVVSLLDYYIAELCSLEKNHPEIGKCEILLSLECERKARIEYYFALMLAWSELKGSYERKYSGLEYPIKLIPACPFFIRDIDLSNGTFILEPIKL